MRIFLVLAGAPKTSIFCIMWDLGWFGMGQNTPTGCGNDLPIGLRVSTNQKNTNFISAPLSTYCVPPGCLLGASWVFPSWYGVMTIQCFGRMLMWSYMYDYMMP